MTFGGKAAEWCLPRLSTHQQLGSMKTPSSPKLQELYLPPEQPRASWRAAEQAILTALAQEAAPEQVPIPTVR